MPGQFADKAADLARYSPAMQSALTRLDDLVNWERRTRTADMRVSALPARTLLSRMGNPQSVLRAVHVTGSKGKGTVSALIAAGLRCAPFAAPAAAAAAPPVAVYSSPHVECITERLRLGTAPVGEKRFAASLHAALDARAGPREGVCGATWFDVMTAAALHACAAEGVRRAVVEVGIGGRLDSTNVLGAPVSVVTNIQLEHADVIGPTLRDIAYEKAGVIAGGGRVVVGMDERHALAHVFREEAASVEPHASVRFVPPRDGDTLLQTNVRVARAALAAVAESEGLAAATGGDASDEAVWLPDDAVRGAFVGLPARQERFVVPADGARAIDVLLDGAHVPESVGRALDEARLRDVVTVLALSEEKDVAGICKAVVQRSAAVVATAAGSGEPYLRAETLASALRQNGAHVVGVMEDACDALEFALDVAAKRDAAVAIVGSFHLAGRVRRTLRTRHIGSTSGGT